MLDFRLFGRRSRPPTSRKDLERAMAVTWEWLENRQLLSASMFPPHGQGGLGGPPPGPGGHGPSQTIEFSQAPSAVQTGLDSLASTDGVTAPADTSTIHLGNVNGVETYTYDAMDTGKDTRLTVDQNGVALTAPTHSTTTFGAITNTAVTDEINSIATALNLTAPTSTSSVDVLTAADGSATYNISLSPASTDSNDDDHYEHNALISVDSNGNPVGHERVPLSVLSTVIQNGLTSNAPSGATALDGTSLIDVNSIEGATLYTAHYSSTGTQTTVTVNAAGALTSLPSIVQATFGDIPMAAQTELQALATADGFTGTIDATVTVTESIEVNGTIIYTIHLPITADDSTARDVTLTLSVDAMGNPTVPPGLGAGREGPPKDRERDDDDGSDSGDDNSSGSGSTHSGCDSGSSGTSDSGSSDSSGSDSSSGSSDSSTPVSVGSDVASSPASTTTTTTSSSSSSGGSDTGSVALTKAEQRAAVKAAAKAGRVAKVQARQAAAAARKAAKLAAAAAKAGE